MMSEEFGLKRVLGLSGLVAIAIGTTVGAGIFSLTALAARLTGPSVPLAFLCAAVPIMFIMMTVGMMGSALPTVGGTYRYPSRLFSPRWALVGVWCYALGLVFGAFPMYATECAHYLKSVWPSLPVKPAAILLLAVFFLVNLFGISIAALAQAVMVAILIVALLAFSAGGVPQLDLDRFQPLFQGGAGGFVVAACILTFALQGSNSVIELGAEIKRPSRNIPLSLAIAIPTVTLLYILVAVAAVGNIDLAAWMSHGKQANLTQPAEMIFGSRGSAWFLFFLVGGAMLAFTTTLNGTFMWATKSLMVVARDGIMPRALARTSRFGTPALFLTIIFVLAVIAVLLDAGIEIFASYATIGGMIIFIPTMISAMLLPRRAPEVYAAPGFRLRGFMLHLAPVVGIITSALLILVLLVDLFDKSWLYPALFLVWFGLGFVFYAARRKKVELESGEKFETMIQRDLEKMIADSQKRAKRTLPGPGGPGSNGAGPE